MIYSSTSNKGKFLNFIYLHGQLEDFFHYDCCTSDKPLRIGMYDVEVYGYPYKCRAFIWNFEEKVVDNERVYSGRGLIVDANDKDANAYAIKKFIDKAKHL